MNNIHNSNEENNITLPELLRQGWLAAKIMTYLGGKDAIRFASLSRDSRVVRLEPPLALPQDSFQEDGPRDMYQAKKWQDLPPLHSAHTVYLKCSWSDQGWGNRKGMLSVVANGGRAPDDYKPRSEKVVCHEYPAPHRPSPLCLSFRPDAEDETNHPYSIWVRIGGGGGHSLDVRNLCVRVLCYTTNRDNE